MRFSIVFSLIFENRTFFPHISILTKNDFFVKIEVCGKNVRFLNISENTKENLINFRTDFIFALISRHFISLSRYFKLWKVMPK